jgi:hydrogenase nickel incorporation protein HypA/HybF
MHELSIALSMIEMASEEATRHGASRVSALYLKLGPLSGVVKEALTFSFDIACEGTRLEGAQLLIEDVPVVIHCGRCRADHVIENIQDLRCPRCGDLSAEVIHGRELELVSLELAELEEVTI